MKRAVFLDRDGTIIKEIGYLTLRDIGRVRFFKGAAEAIKKLNQLGFIVVVVTNQPVVARGLATEKEIDKIHAILVNRLAKKGAKIDAIYSCPHHPEATLPKYRVRCRCRKPNIGMIMKAAKKFTINLKKSFIVGDRTADIAAGQRAGVTVVLVKTGYGGKDGKYDGKPDFVARNLREAVEIIKTLKP
jgi:mannose-1-phosphate guanylyltransferase/phosphomannomutase